MTNAELIDGLRCCAESTNIIERCDIADCPYHSHSWACIDDMLRDAADALEAADKRIEELSLNNKMLKNTIDADKGVMLDRIRFLEAQVKKYRNDKMREDDPLRPMWPNWD